jgi:hypothetical protein
MATNIKYPGPGVSLNLAVSAGVVSGDAVQIGKIHGVAVEDRGSDGYAVVKLPYMFVADLAVEAVDNDSNSAVSIGDELYYDSAATIKINKDNVNGVFIGLALEAITSGSNDTIMIAMAGAPGASGQGVTQHAHAYAKLDLSGAAQADVPILHVSAKAVIKKLLLLYTEASSADAGVAVKVGKETDDDYYYTGTSEVSKSQWYEADVTLLNEDIAAGDTVICSNAGGKTGTGEILVCIEYALE